MRRPAALAAALMTATSMLVGGSTGASAATSFVDVPSSHVFVDEIAWLADEGISRGYPGPGGTRFDPSAPVLREQMAAFLYRVAGEPDVDVPATSPFRDVPTSHVFYDEIVWLAQSGVSTGYDVPGGKEFRPSQPVLREQMAAFLHRLREGDLGVTEVPPLPAGYELFTDVASTHVFYDEILWLAYVGITTGYEEEDGVSFRPSQPVLREQMAAFLHRYERPVYGGTFRYVAPFSYTRSMSDDGRVIVHGTESPEELVAGLSVWSRGTGVSTPVVDLDGSAEIQADRALVSGDGDWVVFSADSTRLVADDADDRDMDVYLQNLVSGARVRVTDTSTSSWSSWDSRPTAISEDGRYVVFTSLASDVIDDPMPSGTNLYRWDRETGVTIPINTAPIVGPSLGVGGGLASQDGSRIVFAFPGAEVPEDTNGVGDVYLWDDGEVTLITRSTSGGAGNAVSYVERFSPDGRYVEFRSGATDLAAPHDPFSALFLWDVETQTMTTAPRPAYLGAPADDVLEHEWHFSPNPTFLAVGWSRSDLIPDANGRDQIVVVDGTTGAADAVTRTEDGTLDPNGNHGAPVLSADGRYVMFSATGTSLVPGHADGIFSWDRFGID
jgi:Tol biopolymer transport system component